MIISIIHKGLEEFATTGSKKGINPSHSSKLIDLLFILENAHKIKDINNNPKYRHQLKGEYKDFHSMSVSGNWRIIFKFEDGNVYLLDYLDYH